VSPVFFLLFRVDRNKSEEYLCKREPELEDMENSQPMYIVKNENACLEENAKGGAGLSLHKEIQLYQQKAGIEIRL
jgi:hypothetical protein